MNIKFLFLSLLIFNTALIAEENPVKTQAEQEFDAKLQAKKPEKSSSNFIFRPRITSGVSSIKHNMSGDIKQKFFDE